MKPPTLPSNPRLTLAVLPIWLATLLFVILAFGLLMGCQTTGSGATRTGEQVDVRAACQVFAPIRWSKTDTPETQIQARRHNAQWVSLCQGAR